MARTVQLSEGAYRTLAALKGKGESFSDLVLRLASARKDPTRLLRLRPAEGHDYERVRGRMRKADLARLGDLFPAQPRRRTPGAKAPEG